MANSRLRNTLGALTVTGALAVTTAAHHEGLRTRAYKDVIGVPTICFGETRGVKMGDVKTVDECKWMLGTRLVEFESKTLQNPKCVRNPDQIPDVSYVQFLSFAYNIGTHGFCRSATLQKLNRGDKQGAFSELALLWVLNLSDGTHDLLSIAERSGSTIPSANSSPNSAG